MHGDYQSKLTLMSESLRNDGRVWVPKQGGDTRRPADIPEDERDYYLERIYPSFGNLAPRDISSRAAKRMCDEGKGVGPTGRAGLSRFCRRHQTPGEGRDRGQIRQPLSEYEKIEAEDPYSTPMMIYPCLPLHHGWPLGGLQPDEHHPWPVVLGEANFPTTAPTAWGLAP